MSLAAILHVFARYDLYDQKPLCGQWLLAGLTRYDKSNIPVFVLSSALSVDRQSIILLSAGSCLHRYLSKVRAVDLHTFKPLC